MPFKIIQRDIRKIKVDIIVDVAKVKSCCKIGGIEPGKISVTQALELKAKYIIHTVGPTWIDGKHNEEAILESCYQLSLQKALELECRSIALPLIPIGEFGCSQDRALQIAISAISEFLMSNEMLIYIVVSDRKDLELTGKLFQDVDAFIHANYIPKSNARKYSRREDNDYLTFDDYMVEEDSQFIQEESFDGSICRCSEPESILQSVEIPYDYALESGLDDIVNHVGETFQQCLLRMIDERGLTDASVYKKANIDRKLFSKIRCNPDYNPKKKTVVALAIALELDIEETKDLLARAGIALSPSNKFDLIIEYFITQNIYTIYTINMALFKHNQPILGE